MIDFLKEEAVAVTGHFSRYDMEAIYPALQKIPEDGIYLEIGVKNGRSLMFARKHSKGWVYGIDINNEVHRRRFRGKKNWEFIQADSQTYKWDKGKIDVLFIDGNHDYEFVENDFKRFYRHVKRGGMIFFHDCEESAGAGVLKLFNGLKQPKGLSRDSMQDRPTSMAWVRKP